MNLQWMADQRIRVLEMRPASIRAARAAAIVDELAEAAEDEDEEARHA